MLDAATALLIWGGRIVIISTHNGRGNPFNQMINDIREGRYGEDAVVYRATFDDAVANGLYERMCFMTSQAPTPEGKETWYKRIRNAYGPRRAQMREELDAIPRDGNGICIPGVWIEDAMVADRPVLRLALDDDFALQSVPRREAYVDEWIERHLAPIMRGLSADLRHYAGQDYARHRDFSIIVPMAITQDRLRDVPFVVEMNKVPRRQQQQILWYILRRLPRFCAAALDATGNGEALAEDTADEFGHGRIHQVKLSRTWYGTWMPRFVDLFQDGAILMPKDDALGQDIRAIEQVDGIPMIAKARQQDLKDPELYRHGDFAGAGALALFATLDSPSGPVKARSRRRRSGAQLTRGYA
ncbi:Terminase-like family protein [compost metagenome]